MRKWGLILLLVLLPMVAMGNIVNNSGSLAADSFTIPFYALDTVGNLVAMASGDSVFLCVWYPSGAVAFKDSLAYDGATHITSTALSGYTVYSWKDAVANMDGTPVEGVYGYFLAVKDASGAALGTPHTGHFQLYATTDFDAQMDIIDNDVVVSAINTAAIEAADFAAGAINSTVIGADAIGASELASTAIAEIIDSIFALLTTDTTTGTIMSALVAANASTNTNLATVAGDVQNIDAWNPITDNDSLIIDQSSLEDMAVGSVTGAVGSVTGAVGSVTGAVGSVTAGVTLTNAAYGLVADSTLSRNVTSDTTTGNTTVADRIYLAGDTATWASATDVWNVLFGTAFTAGSMGDSLNNSSYVQGSATLTAAEVADTLTNRANVPVNAVQISGDATAADNLEAMLDGTGGVDLTLATLYLLPSGNDSGVVIKIPGSGLGVAIDGPTKLLSTTSTPTLGIYNGSTGHGVAISVDAGDGINVSSTSGDDIQADISGAITTATTATSVTNGVTLAAGEYTKISDSVGAGTGADSGAVYGALTQWFLNDSVTNRIALRNLTLRGGTNDTALICKGGASAGHGAYFGGNASTTYGILAESGIGGYGAWFKGNTGGASGGIYASASGSSNFSGIFAYGGTGIAHGLKTMGATNGGYGNWSIGGKMYHGTYTQGTDSLAYGWLARGGDGADSSSQGGYGAGAVGGLGHSHGWFTQGHGHGAGWTSVGGWNLGHAVNWLGGSTGGHALYAAAQAGNYSSFKLVGFGTGAGLESVMGASGTFDIIGTLDTVNYAKNAASFGSGTDAITLYAVDTANSVNVGWTKVTVIDTSGADIITVTLGSSGYDVFYLDTGTYIVRAIKYPHYRFDSITLNVSGNATDTIEGYSIASADPNYSTVYGYVYDAFGNPMEGVGIMASRTGKSMATDTAAGTLITNYAKPIYTDTLGYFAFDLRRTTKYDDTTSGYYDITGSYGDAEIFKIPSLYVPDTTAVDITAVIAER